jgi:Transcriptional regulators
MATIRSIAEEANVSIATVSKVLNGKSGVKEETRQLILRVAQDLNYRPNLNARSLKLGRVETIGIIAEDLTVFNTPEIIDGIAVSCDAAGYHYILANLRLFKRFGRRMDEGEYINLIRDAIDVLLSKQVAGIIYIGSHSHLVLSLSEHPEVPFVCAYCTSRSDRIPSVVYDDEKAAYDLTNCLLAHGDTRIGMITGAASSPHTLNRSRGHMRALYDHRIPYDPGLTFNGDWERDCGYTFGKQLIEAGATAIFAQNDIMALGVLEYCNQNDIQVGRDLRLIGFDNREVSQFCRPRLSTVALPLYEIGMTAAQNLLQILSGNEPEQKLIELPCKIIERESTLGADVPR